MLLIYTHHTSLASMEARVVFVVLCWGIAVFLLGYVDFFRQVPAPVYGITAALLMVSLVTGYYANNAFRAFCDHIPLKSIALIHAWRIFAGWLFLSYSGVLSPRFVSRAAYGDIITGFLGLSVFLSGHRKIAYYIFNIVGLLGLVSALGTGIALTIARNTMLTPLTRPPLILIPLFGVPLSWFTNFISLVRLIKGKTNGGMAVDTIQTGMEE